MLRADGAYKKEQMARAVHRLTVAVHEVVSPVGLLEAENAPGTSESEIFHGDMERKKPNQTKQGAIGAN